MEFKPTNFSDYLSRRAQPSIANDYEAQRNGAWAGLGAIAIAGLISLGIPHQFKKPAHSFQNWARLGTYAIILGGGVFTAHKASRMQYLQSRWQALQQAENQTFGNAIGSAVHHQAALDTAYHRAAVQEHFVQEAPARSLPPDREEEPTTHSLPESSASSKDYDLDYSYESNEQYFDWKLFDKQSDKYAHIAIVGGTGDGKSFTAENVSAILSGFLLVSHPHRKPSDYPNIKAIHCGGRNYGEWKTDKPVNFKELIEPSPNSRISFASLVKTLELEMDRRYKLYEKGDENYPMVNVILDEMNTCLAKIPEAIKGKDAPVKNLIREARKVKLRLIMLLQDDSVEALQIQGEGSIRKCFRYVRLGEFAKVHAKRQKDDFLMQWVAQQKHPILVEEIPAIVIPKKTVFEGNKSPDSPKTSNRSAPVSPSHSNVPERSAERPPERLEPSSELSRTAGTEPLERVLDDALTQNVPAFEGRSRSERLELFRIMKNRGYGKEKTIKLGWGISKGGSQKYKDAEAMYDVMLREIEGASELLSFLDSLPFIQFLETRLLPATSGVYFVFDSEYNLYYVGSSDNILLRWNSARYPHHRLPQVEALVSEGKEVKIGWVLTSIYLNLEAELVAKYKPLWNGTH